MKTKLNKRKDKGWTLIELAIVIVVIGILLALVIPFIGRSKIDAENNQAKAYAKVLNEAITRAKMKGDINPVLVGSNATNPAAAAVYLYNNGYLQ